MTTRQKLGATAVMVAAVVLAGYGIWTTDLLGALPYLIGAILGVRSRA